MATYYPGEYKRALADFEQGLEDHKLEVKELRAIAAREYETLLRQICNIRLDLQRVGVLNPRELDLIDAKVLAEYD